MSKEERHGVQDKKRSVHLADLLCLCRTVTNYTIMTWNLLTFITVRSTQLGETAPWNEQTFRNTTGNILTIVADLFSQIGAWRQWRLPLQTLNQWSAHLAKRYFVFVLARFWIHFRTNVIAKLILTLSGQGYFRLILTKLKSCILTYWHTRYWHTDCLTS